MMAGHVYGAPPVSIYVVFAAAMFSGNLTKEQFEVKESTNNKKITILALHLGYGGVEKYLSSLCKMLEDNYEIEIISTYKVLDKPAFLFSNKIKITYLINDKPNKEELKTAIKEKKIINIFKEGFKSLKILYLKRSRNIKAIRKIYSDYIITTRILHSRLVGYYTLSDITKIATEHNYHNDDKRYIRSVINSVKGFDYFVVVSNNLKKFYENKIIASITLLLSFAFLGYIFINRYLSNRGERHCKYVQYWNIWGNKNNVFISMHKDNCEANEGNVIPGKTEKDKFCE